MALDYSYFLSGRGPQDISEAVEDSGACEGTGRLGPPLMDDPVVPDASRTASVTMTDDPVASEPAMVEDEPLGQVAPPMGGSPAAGPVSDDQVEIESKITDQNGEPWLFAHMPWIAFIDEEGKAQKIPARGGWMQTPVGEWQVPDTYNDPAILDDDPDSIWKLKQLIRPGRGKWKPDWQEGWVCNQRTGLWVPDVDNPEEYRRRMEALGIELPKTRAQSTGRIGGGMHVLLDGRDLPEEYWQQGPLGDPCWGDLKCAGFIAAQGARHPFGSDYAWLPDSGIVIVKPSLEYASMIIAERERYREANKGRGGVSAGHRRDTYSMTGEHRNNTLISLRGTLFNLGYSDAEIREMLIARNEQFREPQTLAYLESTVLKPKPNFVRHRPRRHASIPRLRVAPPAELSKYADEVVKDALAPVTEAIAAIRRTRRLRTRRGATPRRRWTW